MAASVLFALAHRHCILTTTTTTSGGGGAFLHRLPVPQRCGRWRAAALVARAAAVPPGHSVSQARAVSDVKGALYQALEGVNRGIFGMTSPKRLEIHGLVELLESRNPTPDPTDKLQEKVDGCWKLIYSTVSILGKKRTKLGLRDFISLGDFFQIIDVKEEKAVNVIKFSARALKILSGQLAIEASYSITTKTRVDIKLESSTITPDQLMNIFQKNYDLLLAIFNPEGWLEITGLSTARSVGKRRWCVPRAREGWVQARYVDESLRIGRDDKANIFVLERADPSEV